MYRYYGGVTRILVPDNLKTGVETPNWYTPVINKTYHEMAEHYDTASTWIIAALRERQSFLLHKVGQQGYRSCMALLKLADKYSVARVEAACKKALSYTPHPSFKNVKTILSTGQDKVASEQTPMNNASAEHGFIHGADYYGRR